MTSPYAPKGEPRRSSEMRDPLTEIRDRLRALGATADEVADWTGSASWAELDDEQRESVAELRTASDDEIRFQIEAIRGGDVDEEDLEQAGEDVTQGVEGIAPAVDAAAHAALADPTVGHGDDLEPDSSGDVPPADLVEGDGTGEQLEPLPDDAYPPDAEQLDDAQAVEIPEGLLDENVPEILEKVGDDRDLAAAVLEVELAEDKPRKTLVEPLRELLESDGDAAG